MTKRERVWLWLLERVPMTLRSRWPLARFYWQPDEIAHAEREAAEMWETFKP